MCNNACRLAVLSDRGHGGCPADTVCFQGREAQPGEDGGGIIPVFHQILFYVQGIDTDAVLIQML